jgi:hypothetical protein
LYATIQTFDLYGSWYGAWTFGCTGRLPLLTMNGSNLEPKRKGKSGYGRCGRHIFKGPEPTLSIGSSDFLVAEETENGNIRFCSHISTIGPPLPPCTRTHAHHHFTTHQHNALVAVQADCCLDKSKLHKYNKNQEATSVLEFYL